MRVLILGGSGMLGHKLWQRFAERFDTYVTFRGQASAYARAGLFDSSRSLGGVSAQDFDSVARAFADVRPLAVVNCIGIVKQDAAAKDPLTSIAVNSLFPHRLAALARAAGARLIHLSTDCVFSGRAGNYSESDAPDAADLYGRTKLLGEVSGPGALTVRTSMIGRELSGAHGLVEWFLSQRGGRVRGFRRAVFSGFTTRALADVLADILERRPELQGVWNVAAEPINKFDLLTLVRDSYGLDIEIEPDESFVCDRSLDARRFREAAGFAPPSWPEMIERMRGDSTPYEEIRRVHAKG
ncbi:MAG TPA: SDR family oxidoreductase [Pyrinomonadaceae bacterium]|jgi:dTDP-4-dehydrorhamnose reductase|nr:SDR family oxidoreductase [Pyrinomonadaceae bacterium]